MPKRENKNSLGASSQKNFYSLFLIGRKPASDTLNTWRGVIEPSVKAHRVDGAVLSASGACSARTEMECRSGIELAHCGVKGSEAESSLRTAG